MCRYRQPYYFKIILVSVHHILYSNTLHDFSLYLTTLLNKKSQTEPFLLCKLEVTYKFLSSKLY